MELVLLIHLYGIRVWPPILSICYKYIVKYLMPSYNTYRRGTPCYIIASASYFLSTLILVCLYIHFFVCCMFLPWFCLDIVLCLFYYMCCFFLCLLEYSLLCCMSVWIITFVFGFFPSHRDMVFYKLCMCLLWVTWYTYTLQECCICSRGICVVMLQTYYVYYMLTRLSISLFTRVRVTW